jgi:hypothetical protein
MQQRNAARYCSRFPSYIRTRAWHMFDGTAGGLMFAGASLFIVLVLGGVFR